MTVSPEPQSAPLHAHEMSRSRSPTLKRLLPSATFIATLDAVTTPRPAKRVYAPNNTFLLIQARAIAHIIDSSEHPARPPAELQSTRIIQAMSRTNGGLSSSAGAGPSTFPAQASGSTDLWSDILRSADKKKVYGKKNVVILCELTLPGGPGELVTQRN